jgi:cell filamentation protein
VLRNLTGVTKKRDIDQLEFEAFVRVQLQYEESEISADTRFTPALLCQMHRDWLGEIYEWAGRYRTVNLSKSGFTWPPAYLVPSNMDALGAGLLRECTPCRGADLDEVADRIARTHGELLLIHPFREGNGRLARWLADLMSLQAGCPKPDWQLSAAKASQRGENYLTAVGRAYLGDYRLLTDFVREAVERGTAASDRSESGMRSRRAPSKRDES